MRDDITDVDLITLLLTHACSQSANLNNNHEHRIPSRSTFTHEDSVQRMSVLFAERSRSLSIGVTGDAVSGSSTRVQAFHKSGSVTPNSCRCCHGVFIITWRTMRIATIAGHSGEEQIEWYGHDNVASVHRRTCANRPRRSWLLEKCLPEAPMRQSANSHPRTEIRLRVTRIFSSCQDE